MRGSSLVREFVHQVLIITFFLLALSIREIFYSYWHNTVSDVVYLTICVVGLVIMWFVIATIHSRDLEKAISDAKKWEIIATEAMKTRDNLGDSQPEKAAQILGQIRKPFVREVRVFKLRLKIPEGWEDDSERFVYVLDPTAVPLLTYFNWGGISCQVLPSNQKDFDSWTEHWREQIAKTAVDQGLTLVFDEEPTLGIEALETLENRLESIRTTVALCA